MPRRFRSRPYLIAVFVLIAALTILALYLLSAGDHPDRGGMLIVLAVVAAAAILIMTLLFTRWTAAGGERLPATNSGGSSITTGVDRDQLAAVLEHNADGVLAIDAEGRLRFMNRAARRLLEIGERDPLAESEGGRSFVSVVRDHDLDGVLRQSRESGTQQTRLIQLGPQRRPVEAIVLPLRDAGEWRFLGLLHDLTELRRAEGVRRDLVSNLSHELRTPLSSIRATLEVLGDGVLEQPELAREFLAAIQQEVDRLSQLVEEMLELSRIEAGNVPFSFEPVDAGELCREAVKRLESQAERGGIGLSCTLDAGMRPIRADRERLLRVLINLIHNAIKFTDAGAVAVEARGLASEAEILIRDTGSGIAPADLDRIFERFYKADRARSSTGTGLGLAIVKHNVQAHGGRIEVESTVGVGSVFRLLLPYAD